MPAWAILRVNAVLAEEYELGRRPTDEILARRTGLSKRFVRRCLIHSAMASGENKLQPPTDTPSALSSRATTSERMPLELLLVGESEQER
jgi:hypothetical protein